MFSPFPVSRKNIEKRGTPESVPLLKSFYEQDDKPGYVVEWSSISTRCHHLVQATYTKADGPPYAFCSVLLRMGFTCAPSVTRRAVVSYTALPPLPAKPAVYFCCTVPGVTSARRYLALCPVKPGLSSPAAFRFCGSDHLSYSMFPILALFPRTVKLRL